MLPAPLKRFSTDPASDGEVFLRAPTSFRASVLQRFVFWILTILSASSSGVLGQSFLVDFGPWTTSNSTVTTPPAAAAIRNGNYWNFINNSTVFTNPVTTIEGSASSVNITQSGGSFNTGLQFVTGSPDLSNLGVFNIDTVYCDAIFQAANVSGTVFLSALDSDQTYDFILFGSRVATDNRTTSYTINGSSAVSGNLQTSGTNLGGTGINYNNSSFYTATAMSPNASSNITVTYVNPTGFSYLSAMGVVGYVSYGNGSSITLSAAKDYPGATVLSNGTILNANATGALGNATTGSALVFRSSNTTVNLGADQTIGSLSGNGTLSASTYALTVKDNTSSFYLFNSNGTLNNIGNNTFSGNITGSGTINKTGNQTLTLSGSGNTFNGTLTVSSGTLALGNINAVQNATLIANSTVTLDAVGTYTIGALGGSANINNNSNKIVTGANNASTIYSGSLSGSGELQKVGTGSMTLSGSNAFTGDLRFDSGTILVGNNNALGSSGSGAIVIHWDGSGQTLAASGASSYTIGRAMSVYNNLNLGQAATNTGSLDFSGAIALGNEANQTRTITTATNTSHTFSGAVSGARGIVKEGSGTLTLSGANTYTGATTINAGTLLVNGNSASTAVTANAGVIGGSGSVGDLVVNSGARIAPGAASSIGTLSANTLTLAGGAGYTWQIGNVSGSAGTNWDLLNIGGGSGAATISATSGNKFTIYVGSTGIPTGWSPGSSGNWNIIDWGTATGFDANAFAIDTSGFGGVLSGTWSVSNTGGFLNLAYAGVAVPTWNGGSGNWSTGFTQTPVNADNIFFAGASAATATNNISSASLSTVANITFESTAGAFTLAANSGSAGYDASSALAITGFILNSSNADQTLNTALSFGGNATIYASSGNLIFSGPLANAQTLTIADNGGVQVTGAISNNGTILQSGNGTTTLSGAISGSGVLTKNGTGTLTLSGSNSYSGVTTVNAGTLALSGGNAISNSGAVVVNSSGILSLGASETLGSISGAGSLALGSSTLTTGQSNTNDTFSGVISGAGGGLTKNGTGSLTLSGSNTYTGTTTLNAGTLNINNTSAIGSGTLSINGGTLDNTSGGSLTISTNNVQNWNGNFTFAGSNALNLGSGNKNMSGAIAITTSSGTLTIDGQIVSTGGTLVKQGAGTLIMSDVSRSASWTSPIIQLQSGTLGISEGYNLGAASGSNLTFTGDSTLQFQKNAPTEIAGNRIYQINSGVSATIDTQSHSITIGNGFSGSGSLVKIGSGNLTLNGTNSYTGTTTISAGTLRIGNNGTTGTLASPTIVNNAVLAVNRSNALTLSGNISGSGSLQKTAGGVLTLSGSNSFSGGISLTGGSIVLGAAGAAGTGTIALQVSNNGFDVNGQSLANDFTMSSGAPILFNSSTTASILSGTFTSSGGAGMLLSNRGDIEFTGRVYGTSGWYLTVSGQSVAGIPNSSVGGNITISGGGTDNSNTNINMWSAATLTLNKTSSASVHAMGGQLNSTHGGALIKLAGTGDDQIWDGSSVNINAGGFDLNGRNETITNMRLNSDGPDGLGALRNNSAGTSSTLTVTGTLAIGMLDTGGVGTAPRIGGAGNLTIAGRITENTTTSFTKVGLGTLTLTGNNSYTGGTTISAGSVALGHANALGTSGNITFSGGGIQYGSGITTDLSSRIKNSGSAVIVDTNGQNITFASAIDSTNSGGLTKNGTGTLTLSAGNSYTGGTTINAGTIEIGAAGALGSGTYSGNIVNNGSLILSGTASQTLSGVISGSGGLTVNGSTVTLSGSNSYTGNTTLVGASVTIGNASAFGTGRIDVNSGTNTVTGSNGVSTLTGNNPIALNGGWATFQVNGGGQTINFGSGNVSVTGNNNLNAWNGGLRFDGVVSGSGLLNWYGGGSLALGGANTFSGAVTAQNNNGSLILANTNALQSATLNFGANHNLSFGVAGNNTYNIAGISATNAINLGGNTLSIGSNNAASTISGSLSGNGGGLTKVGTAALTLSGSNSYTGGTVLNAGTLNIGHASALGTGTFSIGNSTTIDNTSGGALTLAGNNALSIDNTFTFTGTNSLNLGTGAVTRSGAIVINGTNNATLTIGGVIGGAGNVNYYSGSGGTLEFAGANTFTGYMNVDGGNFKISNVNALQNANFNPYGATASVEFGVAGTNTYHIGMLVSSKAIDLGANSISVGANNESNIYSGSLSGTGGLTKVGTGSLTLSGANTYTGHTIVSAGTLALGASNVLSNSSNLTINGGTFDIGAYSDTVNVITMTNGSLIGTSGVLTGTTYNITGGTLAAQLGGGTIVVGNGTTSVGTVGSSVSLSVNGASAVAALTNNVAADAVSVLNGGSITGAFSLNASGGITSNSGSIASNLIGSGGVTMNGAGNTLTLTGSNTYTGATTISAGTISISNVAALGSTSGVGIGSGATLTYSGSSATLDRAITASAGTATLRNTGSGTLTLSGALSKNGTTLTFAQGTFDVTGAIGGSAANSDLIVDTATVTLNGANTYNGPTIIRNGGALTANVANALPTANGRTTVVMDATGTGSSSLTLGASQSIASLEGAATSTVALGSNTLTTGTTSGTTAFAGTISGSGNLVKDGASTQRLTGANTFTGSTTISSGTLEAAAANALGSTSSIVVQNGGSLLVSSDDALSSTATISLGSGSGMAGIIFQGNYSGHLGSLTLSADSIIDLGSGSVQIIFDSIAAINNYRLTFWNWTGNTQWSGNAGGGTDQIKFTNNSGTGLPNYLNQISFYSDAGVNLLSNNAFLVNSNPREIVAVPEPSAIIAGFLLLGGLAFQFLRQKRRQRLP